MAQWSPGNTVVVLGAGATRGAEFVARHNPICTPPLNADFFTQLQRIQTQKHQSAVDGVLKDVLRIYGPNYQVTLEQYVTQLESMADMLEILPVASPAFSAEGVDDMRKRLLVALSAVLEESADVTKNTSLAKKEPCSYHARIADQLKAKDTIITFNYDCVIDDALRRVAGGRWSAQYGYCFPNPGRVRGFEPWDADDAPGEHNASINLLKLHGSLNWRPLPTNDSDEIRLRERPYKQAGDKEFELVPPENSKRLSDRPVLKHLWGNAERALRRAGVLALIGFSFTPTDLHVDSLFRLAMTSNKRLKRVVIVNPSADHRRAIRAVLTTRLGKGIRLVQFDRLSDFANHTELLAL
jgi:hypothetical protein